MAIAALSLGATESSALGLGRLAVQSALGETLRAEIDVTSLTPDEAANLKVRIATPEAYRAAGVDYNNVLPTTQAALLKRADGRAFLRLTSDRVVQEPFVDVILELSWATGRLVREYTLLFDPLTERLGAAPASVATAPVFSAPAPAVAAKLQPVPIAVAPAAVAVAAAEPVPVTDTPAPAPTAPSPAMAEPMAPAAEPTPASAAAPAEAAPAPARTAAAKNGKTKPERAAKPARPAAEPAAATTSTANAYRVKTGDTLGRIAARTRAGGASLDQTLVSLYRGNPQAFIKNNMNRLKAGVVLSVPSAETAAAVDAGEARQMIRAQSADFGSFRQRLASAVPAVRADASVRKDSGKLQAKVEDRKVAAATPDKLTLSKGASAATGAASEVKISKEKEKQAAAARMAELSKNVEQLKKLSGAASAGKGTTVGSLPLIPPAAAPSTAAVKAVPPAATVVAAAPVLPNVPSVPPVAAVASAAASAVVTAPVVAAPVAAASALIPETKPVVADAPVVASAPAVVAAASAVAPAPKRVEPPVVAADTTSEPGFLGDLLGTNPWFLALGGGALLALLGFGVYRARKPKLDSGETSFLESRLQPDSFFGASGGQRIDTREATNSSPSSMSYSLSQLDAIGDVDPVAEADVYLAYGRDLQAEEILKEAMRSNPDRLAIRTKLLEVYAKRRDTKGFELLATQLYSLTGGNGEDWNKAQELGRDIDPDNSLYQAGGLPASMVAGDSGLPAEPLGASTMPQSVLPTQSRFARSQDENLGHTPAEDIDFDLDLDPSRPVPLVTQPGALESFDFKPAAVTAAAGAAMGAAAASFMPSTAKAAVADSGPASSLKFDLSGISLDLDKPATAAHSAADSKAPHLRIDDDIDHDNADPLVRKLELAEEFRQIGDSEGARDLLQEVASKADGALKSKALGMLAELG